MNLQAISNSLPVCDYRLCTSATESDRRDFSQTFGDSLRHHGFAILAQHSVELSTLAEAFALCEKLFSLPLEEKQTFEVPESKGNRGYVGFGGEKALGATVADLKEFWHFGQPSLPAGSPLIANRWPMQPSVHTARAEFTKLFQTYEQIARGLLRSIATYLDQPSDWLASMIDGGDSILRLIHYPPVAADSPTGAIRAAAHEDINLITLLAEGTSGGLELLSREHEWIPVQSLKGQLVINAGDMLQRVTHGRLRSTTHRVVNPPVSQVGAGARYSMPFFTHPRPEVRLTPLAPEANYTGIAHTESTAGAFLQERLAGIIAGITSPRTP